MLGHALVVVSDAHLGVAPPDVEERLLAFLEDVPALGDCLLVNGDLFDFWYSYSRVIPRRGFRVAAALAALGRRLPIVMVGGNHDRWGGDFWARETGIRYEPSSASFEVGHRRVLAIHGDGLDEPGFRAALLHRLINHPITAAVYRSIHPDLGLRLVDKLSPHLGNHEPNATLHDAVAERQRVWAERRLLDEPELGLLVMGHTHRPALQEIGPGRHYLNPGAWFDGFRYAVATESGAALHAFTPAAPPLPPPAAPQ